MLNLDISKENLDIPRYDVKIRTVGLIKRTERLQIIWCLVSFRDIAVLCCFRIILHKILKNGEGNLPEEHRTRKSIVLFGTHLIIGNIIKDYSRHNWFSFVGFWKNGDLFKKNVINIVVNTEVEAISDNWWKNDDNQYWAVLTLGIKNAFIPAKWDSIIEALD